MARPFGTKNIESPEILWELFEKYEQWCKKHPVSEQDFVGQLAEEVTRKYERPLTWFGFESYLFRVEEIISSLAHYEQNNEGRYTDYLPIIRKIKDIIKDQQVSGAMVGVYNSNLTARLNGLTEKTENKNETKLDGNINITFDIT